MIPIFSVFGFLSHHVDSGFLVEEDNTAMIWRGPMVMSAITQMLRDVAWARSIFWSSDMPPGNGRMRN